MAKKFKFTRDEQRSMDLGPPCTYCQHLLTMGTQMDDDPEQAFRGWTCKAFEEEIPPEILLREEDHVDPDWGQPIGNTFAFKSKIYDFENGKAVISFDGDWYELE